MTAVRVTPTENGPYQVTGPIELIGPDGVPIEVPGETVFLCRCGGSTNKPFCDSWRTRASSGDAGPDAERVVCARHSKVGLPGASTAVAESQER